MRYTNLIGVSLIGALVALTLVSPKRPPWLGRVSYLVSASYNEIPYPFLYLVVITAIDPIRSRAWTTTAGGVFLGASGLVAAGLIVLAWRGTRARPAVETALDESLGADWRRSTGRWRPPLGRILLMPLTIRPRAVRKVPDITYGDAGRANRLDLYHHRSKPEGAPVLIHLHGGGFQGGRKSFESRALLFRLAQQGWVTISANYRLRPEAGFRDHLVDVKKVIAWVRETGPTHGADPSMLVLAGSSAGGTLSAIAAVTQNDPFYQPGFEEADTSVHAVVSLYGWYGAYYGTGQATSAVGALGTSPQATPPFFIAHGARDSLAGVESARRFVARLRSTSSSAVVYAELSYGQHAFDVFHSLRFSAVVDGVEAFTTWVRHGR